MKYHFGTKSQLALSGCHFILQHIAREALAYGLMDFAVIEGHRPKRLQDHYFFDRPQRSMVAWPGSRHNRQPSEAMDCVPYINGALSWDERHCLVLAGIILAAARKLGYEIRWGGNWDRDGEPVSDQDFQDLVHFELAGA